MAAPIADWRRQVVSDKKTFVNTKKGEEEIETRKLSDGEVQKRTRFEGK